MATLAIGARRGGALWRGGVMQGAMHQPPTTLRATSLSLAVRTDWP